MQITNTHISEATTPELQIVGQSYDEIYVESWKAALSECDKKLEPIDRDRALEVKNMEGFRTELNRLLEKYPDEEGCSTACHIAPVPNA